MKRPLSRILALACLLTAFAVTTNAQQKVGYVDLKKLFDGYWKTKQADSNLKDRAGEFDKQKKVMLDDYEKAQNDYKKLLDSANDQAVAVAEREKIKKNAEAKLIELREIEQSVAMFDRTARTQLGERQKTERDKILEDIRGIVASRAKSSGYSIVFDTASETLNNTTVFLYTDGKDDLTDEVLKQLNATAPVTLPASTPDTGKKK